MIGKINIGLVREDDSARALLQCCFKLNQTPSVFDLRCLFLSLTHERNDLRRLRGQLVCKLFIEVDQITDVDVAKVLLEQRIFLQLISVHYINTQSTRRP